MGAAVFFLYTVFVTFFTVRARIMSVLQWGILGDKHIGGIHWNASKYIQCGVVRYDEVRGAGGAEQRDV